MLVRPSFFALNVAPSAREKVSRAIDSTLRSWNPSSRILMK